MITYRIEAEQDDARVRGNAMASGDDEVDREVEDEILARLDRGDIWAWAQVTVIASFRGFEGRAYLGCCSYTSEANFVADGYYADMCQEAASDLRDKIEDAIARGVRANGVLTELAKVQS